LFSWGEPGDASHPGQFHLPHDVCLDSANRVYVADRMNLRIQVFSAQGEFITQWRDVRWPNALSFDGHGHMYVAELGGVFWSWPDIRPQDRPARVTVRDLNGNILAELQEQDPSGGGRYFCPHGVAVDSRGDLYVGEVSLTHTRGTAPTGWPVLRKYIRI